MNRQTFLLQLDDLLELPSSTLKGPEELDALENWNSMAMVSFIALADEHFDYSISPRQFANCKTVNDLLGLIKPLAS
jgi:acyl carrier protein